MMRCHFFEAASYVVYDSKWNGSLPIFASNVSCIHQPLISAFDVIVPVIVAILPSMPMPLPAHFHVPAMSLPAFTRSAGGFMSGFLSSAEAMPTNPANGLISENERALAHLRLLGEKARTIRVATRVSPPLGRFRLDG